MKFNKLLGLAIAGTLYAGAANAVYIDDVYFGKDTNVGPRNTSVDLSTTDRYGLGFEVYGADVSRSGTTYTVKIDTDFVEDLPKHYYGDLFISTDGYNPVADSQQDYGMVSDDPATSNVGTWTGPGESWELAFDTDGGVLLGLDGSEKLIQGTQKQGQEVRVDSGGRAVRSASSFSVLGDIGGDFQGSNVLQYVIDLSFLGDDFFSDRVELGLHWTMYCANDVFEARVAEPGSVALLSLGLLGLGIARRKSKKA